MSKNTILILLILLGVIAAGVTFSHRLKAESRNRRIELVVDWADAQQLANTTSLPIDDVLTQLHHAGDVTDGPHKRLAGVTTIAVSEDTLESLRGNGVLSYSRVGNNTILTFTPGFADQQQRVEDAFQNKMRLKVAKLPNGSLQVEAPWAQFNGLPIGLDDTVVQTVRRNHLLVAPRLLNYTGVTAQSIAWELAKVKQQCRGGAGPLIFSGSAVLGNRPLLQATADAIHQNGFTYGSVEFAKTLGDADLSRMAAPDMVRVHSIGNDEMGTMDEPTAQERFVRAAKERNIRVCYVRLFINGLVGEPDVIQANTKFLAKIVDGIYTAHQTVGGPAHPYADDPTPPKWARLLMGLGVAAGLLLLLRAFTGIDGAAFAIAAAVAVLLCLGLAWPELSMKGREILALIAACIFPALGFCVMPVRALTKANSKSTRWILAEALGEYIRITISTLAGVLIVVGLLSGRIFLLKIDQFLGVKAVLVAPVLLVALYYGLGLFQFDRHAPWSARRDHILAQLRALAAQPLLLGQVVLGIVTLVALALFVARSGNDPGVGVSASELKMRALLDKYLLVRPRTKEFLLGHPALLFGLAAAASGRFKKAIVPLLIVGAIGQSSLQDTFCHLHTPLLLSSLRALIGWALGALVGAILYAVALAIARRQDGAQTVRSAS
ncbi:hypothetical protein CCAX7_003810 [Capsulimonas corticalis]|uniref:Uncharacterized protein n=1 Tax=Capsulimonas corticalis TaxID=2219043 RepID=A0A402D346_9BACT|nr:DUF5693 family protein [Capsulimonas corticalis]BDI28330.1 hypothetical protein CCAX7_003810 [Capsulimonas corticalis]